MEGASIKNVTSSREERKTEGCLGNSFGERRDQAIIAEHNAEVPLNNFQRVYIHDCDPIPGDSLNPQPKEWKI